ncbi:MAG: ATP-dependent DNA helicase, partial [Dehalococcoidia bacterium]
QRLMVEAGTGTGKSLAYLIPAACHALANGSRVVVSTATINLQEQLSGKDIAALKSLLQARPGPAEGGPARELRSAQLKGRRNYLCLRRFAAMQGAAALSDDEAKLMARLLIWLVEAESGDRSELNLSPAEEALWPRLSAEGMDCQAQNCPFVAEGTCFLHRARRRAEAAHIVVVNHALLLSDVAVGGYLLPPYDNLIVDEAHHLEEEATRRFGFSAREEDVLDLLERCARLEPQVRASLRGAAQALSPSAHLVGIGTALAGAAQSARPRVGELAETARAFLRQHAAEGGGSSDYDARLLIDRAMRIQPDWSQVEIAWDNLRLALTNVLRLLESLTQGLTEAEGSGLLDHELLAAEAGALQQEGGALLEGLGAAIESDDAERIVWLEEDRQRGSLTLAWAPLSVAEALRDRLYADKNAVMLTGATLTTARAGADGEGFEYVRERLGLDDAHELSLGSSFDYERAALVLVPEDMPEPNQPGYLETMAQAISDLARASQGRALVLFTAHSSLRAAHPRVRSALQGEGIDVLGQGIDGRPSRLLQALRTNPRTVLLGTASFWEGVDVAGEALSLLVIARLPFSVPTEPVFAARSALYDDPFHQYALPQAVLRFKQGFGRLIRTKYDRGVVAVLDRRIVSKRYGSAFLDALP